MFGENTIFVCFFFSNQFSCEWIKFKKHRVFSLVYSVLDFRFNWNWFFFCFKKSKFQVKIMFPSEFTKNRLPSHSHNLHVPNRTQAESFCLINIVALDNQTLFIYKIYSNKYNISPLINTILLNVNDFDWISHRRCFSWSRLSLMWGCCYLIVLFKSCPFRFESISILPIHFFHF